MARHRGYRLYSGRLVLGEVVPSITRNVYKWRSRVTKDRGITGNGFAFAVALVLREAKVSPRAHEVDLVDITTKQRRPWVR